MGVPETHRHPEIGQLRRAAMRGIELGTGLEAAPELRKLVRKLIEEVLKFSREGRRPTLELLQAAGFERDLVSIKNTVSALSTEFLRGVLSDIHRAACSHTQGAMMRDFAAEHPGAKF
tara:strand:- start:4932 stop:5285 length:354 start_codon:yes stop_codon:yes gene_type:complete